jgi:hypothetical protein
MSWWLELGKIRLFVRARKQGSRIESVPLKRLVRLSKSSGKRWFFKKTVGDDGWLILEADGWFLKCFSVFCVFVLSLFFSDYGKVNFTLHAIPLCWRVRPMTFLWLWEKSRLCGSCLSKPIICGALVGLRTARISFLEKTNRNALAFMWFVWVLCYFLTRK